MTGWLGSSYGAPQGYWSPPAGHGQCAYCRSWRPLDENDNLRPHRTGRRSDHAIWTWRIGTGGSGGFNPVYGEIDCPESGRPPIMLPSGYSSVTSTKNPARVRWEAEQDEKESDPTNA